MAFSWDGEWLIAVGGQEGRGTLSVVEPAGPVSECRVVQTVGLSRFHILPSVAVDSGRRVYIGDASTSRVTVLSWSPDRMADEPPATSELFSPDSGVSTIGVSDGLGLAFVSATGAAKFSAIELAGANAVRDALDWYGKEASASGGVPIPLATYATIGNAANHPTASFLVGDHQTGVMLVIDYDPRFGTLDLVASVPLAQSIRPGARLAVEPSTRQIIQPVLLASDESQETVLAGNLYSTSLVQYSRNGSAVERISQIALPGQPTAIAVSADGSAAVVALAGSTTLQVLSRADNGDISESVERTKFRQLQRALNDFGMELGAIDGIPGSATVNALRMFQEITGADFELTDTDAALAAVTQALERCGETQGLRCLLTQRQESK